MLGVSIKKYVLFDVLKTDNLQGANCRDAMHCVSVTNNTISDAMHGVSTENNELIRDAMHCVSTG